MRKLLLRSMVSAGAALVVLALLCGCGSTPQPTEPPPTQTPWVVIVTSTAGPTQAAAAQPTATPAPTRRPTDEPTEPSPTQAPTRTAAAGTTPETATATTEAEDTPAPTVTTEATAAAAPSGTPQPTNTPGTAALRCPPPVLLEPPANRPVSWGSTILLIWASDDEYYHVHMERRPRTAEEPWYGDYIYTKDTQFLAEGAFLAPFHPAQEHGHGIVYWWVRVVRKTGEDKNGKPIGIDISPSSEERTLILEPKPEG
jgi:hypothetical protein